MNFNDDLIETEEAAQILGVLPRQVRVMVKSGLLLTAPVVKKPINRIRFRRADVLLLAEIRKGPLDYAHVVAMAQQASFTARRLETLVQRLLTILDADLPMLDLSADGVHETYGLAERALQALSYDLSDIFLWSQRFLAIGPEFFEAVEKHVGDPEPWLLFTDLARKIVLHCADNFRASTMEETAALQYLGMSSRALRKAAFIHVHRKVGISASVFLFPETLDDLHYELSALAISLYQHRPAEAKRSKH